MRLGRSKQPAPAEFEAQFGEGGALRQPVGRSGRAHLDRALFFLVLNRSQNPDTSLARRVAINSPAYLIWSAGDDAAAAGALAAILAEMKRHYPRLLLLWCDDLAAPAAPRDDAPTLPPFKVEIGASGDPAVSAAAHTLGEAMAAVEIDLRRCEIEPVAADPPWPAVCGLIGDQPLSQIVVRLPQIYRAPRGRIYPQLFRELSVASGDALLRSACAFASASGEAPLHYRSLGRRAFLAAALSLDRRLDRIARSFDFLLSVSPINSAAAGEQFLADGGERSPEFRYRPLAIDPDVAKRALFRLDLGQLEDPLLETLFADKRRELDQQLTMLSLRNTPGFRPASILLYGTVEPELLGAAKALLDAPGRRSPPAGEMVDAYQVVLEARALITRYSAIDSRFAARVQLREDIAAGLMVSGATLMVSRDTRLARHRLDALLAHEISVHLLTFFNGSTQGLSIFRTGLAGYEGAQEGLGVFAEWAVGGLTRNRIRLLAARVVAVDAMLGGAGFVDCYRLLTRDHGFAPRAAFNITARVYRSGGLAKDAIYLRGFKAIVDLVAAGGPLDPFWLGKIAHGHLSMVDELLQRGLLHPPRFIPLFLGREDVARRIARLASSPSLDSIFDLE